MSDTQTNWSREEFEAYLLFYAANADFLKSEEEKKLIHSKVSERAYAKMHAEFEKDNDYERIQKIIDTVQRFELSKEEIENLIKEAEKFKDQDEKIRKRVEAKNGLEGYCVSVKHTL